MKLVKFEQTEKFKNGENCEVLEYPLDDKDINSLTGEIMIEIPEGQHTLTIVAVDINNDTETKEQIVRGVISKPNLEVTQEGENLVVKASDEIGLEKVEFILNGQGYRVRIEGATEKQFKYPLEEGENNLEVKAYNTEGATETIEIVYEN